METVDVRTYESVTFTHEEIGDAATSLHDLYWVKSRVAKVRVSRLGVELQFGPYAGQVVIPGRFLIRIRELVPGTAAGCLSLSASGRRHGAQKSSSSTLVAAATPEMAAKLAHGVASLIGAGVRKRYIRRREETGRPRGTVLVRPTVTGPWARGRRDLLVSRWSRLTEDIPFNRLIMSGLRRAELLLMGSGESSALLKARQSLQMFAGVSSGPGIDVLAGLADAEDDTERELGLIASSLVAGLPILPAPGPEIHAYSAWINLERIFEEAVRSIISRCAPEWSVKAGSDELVPLLRKDTDQGLASYKRAIPDIVVRPANQVILLDAKYRRSGEAVGDDSLYQLLAHTTAFAANRAALVVPALKGPPNVIHLGHDKQGCSVDVVSVDPALPDKMEEHLRHWLLT